MSYIFLDESGDLGFDFSKKRTSKYFLLTFLFCENKRPLEKCVRMVHSILRQKYKKVDSTLHASGEEPSTRIRLLTKLAEKDCSIMVIYLNKKRVYTKIEDEKHVLYNYVTNVLLDRIFSKKLISKGPNICLVASRKETNKFLNQNFKDYLQQQSSSNHGVMLKVEIKSPDEEKTLQATDFVGWAIFRKYEYGDDSYSNKIKNKIVEENPLYP
ncbi:MAG: DUF3800 domain-containing protein [Elusimicrobiota bacterium]|nr:DUF3800 domain-containing protein [Elusimicrobiota bacterium]